MKKERAEPRLEVPPRSRFAGFGRQGNIWWDVIMPARYGRRRGSETSIRPDCPLSCRRSPCWPAAVRLHRCAGRSPALPRQGLAGPVGRVLIHLVAHAEQVPAHLLSFLRNQPSRLPKMRPLMERAATPGSIRTNEVLDGVLMLRCAIAAIERQDQTEERQHRSHARHDLKVRFVIRIRDSTNFQVTCIAAQRSFSCGASLSLWFLSAGLS